MGRKGHITLAAKGHANSASIEHLDEDRHLGGFWPQLIMERMLEDSEQADPNPLPYAWRSRRPSEEERKRQCASGAATLKSGNAKRRTPPSPARAVGPLTLRPSGGSPDANPINQPRFFALRIPGPAESMSGRDLARDLAMDQPHCTSSYFC